jgi:signal transduction histidine kinase
LKVKSPRSLDGRLRAGNKGIGRFAAQRLGNTLAIDTKAARSSALRLTIDWTRFAPDADLGAISSPMTPGTRSAAGTELTIDNLRDAWGPDEIRALLSALAPLVQPFALSRGKRGDSRSEFQVYVVPGEGAARLSVHDAYGVFLDLAVAEITGVVDRGRAYYGIRSDRLGFDPTNHVELEDPSKYNAISGVRFCAYYYVRKPGYLPSGNQRQDLREVLDRQGGIRVYRNGFRVLPYGSEHDDWLGLDAEYRRRDPEFLEPFGNFNFLGFVELHDPEGERFQETSSREGLLENTAFRQLRSFVFAALSDAVHKIGAERRRREGSKAVPSTDAVKRRLSAARQRVDELRRAPNRSAREELITLIERDLRSVSRDFAKIDKARLDEVSLLRVLASLGISLAEFVHEVRQVIGFISADLSRLRRTPGAKLDDVIDRVKRNAKLLKTYTDLYDNVIEQNEDPELQRLEIHTVIADFKEVAEQLLAERDVKIDIKDDAPGELFTIPMHPSEWSSILLNLMSNSVKAIRRAKAEGHITIAIARDEGQVLVDFLDDGIGIPKENWDRVFDALFTTTRRGLPASEEPVGLGLGLKIVRDIVAARNGTVAVIAPPAAYATAIRISVPRSNAQR